jgi:hypothetical protein
MCKCFTTSRLPYMYKCLTTSTVRYVFICLTTSRIIYTCICLTTSRVIYKCKYFTTSRVHYVFQWMTTSWMIHVFKYITISRVLYTCKCITTSRILYTCNCLTVLYTCKWITASTKRHYACKCILVFIFLKIIKLDKPLSLWPPFAHRIRLKKKRVKCDGHIEYGTVRRGNFRKVTVGTLTVPSRLWILMSHQQKVRNTILTVASFEVKMSKREREREFFLLF